MGHRSYARYVGDAPWYVRALTHRVHDLHRVDVSWSWAAGPQLSWAGLSDVLLPLMGRHLITCVAPFPAHCRFEGRDHCGRSPSDASGKTPITFECHMIGERHVSSALLRVATA